MNTRVSSKGQIVLPAELRELDAIVPGQRFLVQRLEPGTYLLKRETNEANAGLVDWLLACPDKDWFTPIPSETTDQL